MFDTITAAAHLGLQNLIAPAVLFFVLGMGAGFAKSDLALPPGAVKTFALYLMLCIGFKGGVEAAKAGFHTGFLHAGLAGFALSLLMPLLTFPLFRTLGGLDRKTAAATAAAFGSVSVVTFATGSDFLKAQGVPFGGYMAAVLALMEAPAILTGLLLARSRDGVHRGGDVLREVFLGGPALVLAGSFAIGLATGERGLAKLDLFVNPLFQGVLCLFLLEMGITAAQSLNHAARLPPRLLALSLVLPLAGAAAGLALARLGGLSVGDATLVALLAASASYIAAPAAMRLALPEAQPGVYLGLALGVVFPFNLILGIPLYRMAAEHLMR
ncbi:sodium-dependent bicarbonate transport family permease [Phenylobacterium aquaticum]|uniref:sodium-dependent bicarbonate transport family permease n=1 Tax=Phenylobacterium aquaticum TaxID=1763816 RepID=UPI0026F05D08|nr:sodium-dependent bicarbonate transport family permease [Phenylobacterium aquaticum]